MKRYVCDRQNALPSLSIVEASDVFIHLTVRYVRAIFQTDSTHIAVSKSSAAIYESLNSI